MSESKNTKVEKDGIVKKEKEETVNKEIKKTEKPIHGVKMESTKSDRLDRMEKQLDLIEEGILVLIHSVQWHNLSITPIGTHNPDTLIDGCASLRYAVDLLSLGKGEKISQ